jgi:hypothetical protein
MTAAAVEKSSKKRKGKVDTAATTDNASHNSDPVAPNANGDESNESPYLKELTK